MHAVCLAAPDTLHEPHPVTPLAPPLYTLSLSHGPKVFMRVGVCVGRNDASFGPLNRFVNALNLPLNA